jgi:hypothetical protein
MKKALLLTALLGLFLVPSFAQKVNDKIQISSNGQWYDGKILKVNAEEGKYFISYDNWDESWNEWVTVDRIRGYGKESAKAPLTKFKVGDKVEVEYGMVPEPATIVSVGENKYEIEYENKLFGKKWVTEGQIKKL